MPNKMSLMSVTRIELTNSQGGSIVSSVRIGYIDSPQGYVAVATINSGPPISDSFMNVSAEGAYKDAMKWLNDVASTRELEVLPPKYNVAKFLRIIGIQGGAAIVDADGAILVPNDDVDAIASFPRPGDLSVEFGSRGGGLAGSPGGSRLPD